MKGNKKNSEAHAKTSQKEVATMGQLPDAEFSEMPLPPLRLSEEAAPALLPWLAKGFTPIRTSGKNNMCGLYALWRAFRDAQDALKSPNEKIKHLTQAQFHGFLNSREYNTMADKVVQAQAQLGFGNANHSELREILAQESNLDIASASTLKVSLIQRLTISRLNLASY